MDHRQEALEAQAGAASSAEVRRLGQFFKFNLPVNAAVAAIMFTLAYVFRFWSIVVVALLVVGNIGVLYWSRAQARKGRLEPAVLGIATGVIVQALAGMYLSGGVVLPILGLLMLWPVMIALPYLRKKTLPRLMVVSTAGGAALGLMSLAGDMVGLSKVLPAWVWLTVDAFCLPVYIGFGCQFVWHYSSHLQDTLAQLRTANVALQASERELEQKVAERTQELARKNQELMKLDDMKTRFVTNASHELRSPLTAIRAFSEMLADDPTLNDRQAEFAHIINAETERLSRLANDLLDLNRMESGNLEWRPQRVDLRTEMGLLHDSQRPLARAKGLMLELTLAESLPSVSADPDGLRRVLLNLVQNAVKFTNEGSVVLAAEPAGGKVRISVIDSGVGISPADQTHVFERFYQAGDLLTEKPAGAGLGLAICREILAQHRAELCLESTPGEGSRFSFELPVAP